MACRFDHSARSTSRAGGPSAIGATKLRASADMSIPTMAWKPGGGTKGPDRDGCGRMVRIRSGPDRPVVPGGRLDARTERATMDFACWVRRFEDAARERRGTADPDWDHPATALADG